MNKYTEGPWGVCKTTIYNSHTFEWIGSTNRVLVGLLDDQQKEEANARLIAAAPELLEVLEDIVFLWVCNAPQNARQYLSSKVENIIAKAKGENQNENQSL